MSKNTDSLGNMAYEITSRVVANVADASAADVEFGHGDGLGTIRMGPASGTIVVITQLNGDVPQYLAAGQEHPHLVKGVRAAGSDAVPFTAWR